MFHPFKKLEAAWNARTPVWLHNRTKENIIAQLIAGALLLLGMIAVDEYQYRKAAARRRKALNIEEFRTKN